ncbi:nuclear mRNA splicing factor-associated protein [Trichophyton rubrum]|uniref:Nuclear mRNA splicing factor-associated protein n=1 Tax=Trichophyton rubrum TaxID=5551 RepID=A0A178F4R4_TRIRU|nr:nuclear mRNA splicing factor-associated protein [Trichophyton rubrum]
MSDSEKLPSTFPQPDEFDSDPRVSFSKLDNKYILETDNGEEYTYDDALKRWIPSIQLDESLMEQQRQAYKIQGVDEEEPANLKTLQEKKKKRKHNDESTTAQKPKKPRVNTAVYVTAIPLDATVSEISSLFSKCGVIAEEIDSGKPRIKMYTDEQGAFKGDALVVYFRPESVNLAIQMLDDTDFRFGEKGAEGNMRVQPADFSFKAVQETPAKANLRDKMKIIRKTQKLNKHSGKAGKVVVLKHMFTLQELEEDPAAILDIKEDIREECSKLGEVTNVVLYDKEESGIATVRFSDPECAQACVQMMNGRFFGGTQVEAYVVDGKVRFKKSGASAAAALQDDGAGWEAEASKDDEAQRLDKFGAWLEREEATKKTADS